MGQYTPNPSHFNGVEAAEIFNHTGPAMDHLQIRLEALEQRTHTVERQLRWWRVCASCRFNGCHDVTGGRG